MCAENSKTKGRSKLSAPYQGLIVARCYSQKMRTIITGFLLALSFSIANASTLSTENEVCPEHAEIIPPISWLRLEETFNENALKEAVDYLKDDLGKAYDQHDRTVSQAIEEGKISNANDYYPYSIELNRAISHLPFEKIEALEGFYLKSRLLRLKNDALLENKADEYESARNEFCQFWLRHTNYGEEGC